MCIITSWYLSRYDLRCCQDVKLQQPTNPSCWKRSQPTSGPMQGVCRTFLPQLSLDVRAAKQPKGPFTLLTASHGIMRHSADLESSRQLNSDAIMHRNMLHHVTCYDGMNGGTGIHWLLTREDVLQHVIPSEV